MQAIAELVDSTDDRLADGGTSLCRVPKIDHPDGLHSASEDEAPEIPILSDQNPLVAHRQLDDFQIGSSGRFVGHGFHLVPDASKGANHREIAALVGEEPQVSSGSQPSSAVTGTSMAKISSWEMLCAA